MTSICITGANVVPTSMLDDMQSISVYAGDSPVNTWSISLPAPANTLPGIADAGRISIGAACRPVTRPAPANTLSGIADAGRISIGAACRPATRPAPANTLPSVADAGRISIGAACRPARR